MIRNFWQQEEGVILSAELVLLGTILVLGMIVGLVELQCAVVAELSDLGDAIGNLDQSYQTSSFVAYKSNGIKAATAGTRYNDAPDAGDCNLIITCDQASSRGEKSFCDVSFGGGGGFAGGGFAGGGGSVSVGSGAGAASATVGSGNSAGLGGAAGVISNGGSNSVDGSIGSGAVITQPANAGGAIRSDSFSRSMAPGQPHQEGAVQRHIHPQPVPQPDMLNGNPGKAVEHH